MKSFSHNPPNMATLKLTLDKRRVYFDGRSLIIIRITANQRSTSIDADVKIHATEWDSSKGKINYKHPNYKELNLHIKQILLRYEQKVRSLVSVRAYVHKIVLPYKT